MIQIPIPDQRVVTSTPRQKRASQLHTTCEISLKERFRILYDVLYLTKVAT